MNKEHKKEYIQIGVGVIGGIIVVGGVYLLVRGQQVNAPTDSTEKTMLNTSVETIPEGSSSLDATNSGTTASPAVTGGTTLSTAEKTLYNEAIKNARSAFLAKNYTGALTYYEKAKTYEDSETVYAGVSDVYLAMGEWDKARTALDMAIQKNPSRTEHWRWKLMLLDERFSLSFVELNVVYEQGIKASDPKTKVNLVVVFATIATERGEKEKAIALWNYAAELFPANAAAYIKEVESLK